MITDALVSWIDGGVANVINITPRLPPEIEAALLDAPAQAHQLTLTAEQWSFLVPWDVFGVSIAVILAGIVVGVVTKLVRIAISYITLGGGM